MRRHPYFYVPFQVPQHTTRIDVSYGYSEPVTDAFGIGPGNTVDIGIFDSRGHDFIEAPGFRGWSGTARPEFFIAENDATPGYIRGPLFPGTWNVLLGVDRVEPEGVRYEATVKLTVEEGGSRKEEEGERGSLTQFLLGGDRFPVPGRGQMRSPGPRGAGSGRWVRGDLHCHTLHSDGANSVEEVVRHAIGLGLDFLAVTDHNTNTHHEELDILTANPGALDGPITLIPGEEVTTYWGHANTWGLREWIDFRCADEDSLRKVRDYVLKKGALMSINHPKCVGPPWLFEGWEGYPAMEVWQAPWRFYNWESLERWDALLRAGERVVAVGGSDAHYVPPAEPRHPHSLAEPTTWVWVDGGRKTKDEKRKTANDAAPGSQQSVGRGPSPDLSSPSLETAILDGIRRGRVFVSDGPEGAHVILSADVDGDGVFETMMGDTIEAKEGHRVRFRADVHGGMDRRLWLTTEAGVLDIIPLTEVDSTFEFTLEPAGRRYVRAELRGWRGRPERGEVVWAMGNPVWLGGRWVEAGG
jgi:hypothetical protein